MAKLTLLLLCLALVCFTLTSAYTLRSQGKGEKKGGHSKGGHRSGHSQYASEEVSGDVSEDASYDPSSGHGSGEHDWDWEDIEPITTAQFKEHLQKFSQAFSDASQALAEVEALTGAAITSSSDEDWQKVGETFGLVIAKDLGPLGGEIEHMGELLERIAVSPDDFARPSFCENTFQVVHRENYTDVDMSAAFLKDLGCFKDRIEAVGGLVDTDAEKYSEADAVRSFVDVSMEAELLQRSFHRFLAALEYHNHGGDSEDEDHKAISDENLQKLVRLLKELKLKKKK